MFVTQGIEAKKKKPAYFYCLFVSLCQILDTEG